MIAFQVRMTLKIRAASKRYRWVFSLLWSTPGHGGIRKDGEVLTEQLGWSYDLPGRRRTTPIPESSNTASLPTIGKTTEQRMTGRHPVRSRTGTAP
jgi:hypothetical protein